MTNPDASVAIEPTLLSKPDYSKAQNTSDGNDELLMIQKKLGLSNKHTKKAELEAEEYRKLSETLSTELKTLKEAQQSAVRESLKEQGDYKKLYEQLVSDNQKDKTHILQENTDLKKQLKSVTEDAQAALLKSAALQQISRANAVNPNQLYTLLQPQLQTSDDGLPTVLSSGVEQPLGDYLANLKASADWQHHFSASAARGMGAGSSTTSIAPGMSNPYRTLNFTEAMQLEIKNPELAKQLKAEALRGS